jgi:hypothetical protein
VTIQKIKSGRVTSLDADQFIGDLGQIFYNEAIGDLRLSDGVSPGGTPLLLGSGSGGGNATMIVSPSPPTTNVPGTMWWDTLGSKLYVTYSGAWNPATLVETASATVKGVVKIGNGIIVDPDGTISVDVSSITATPLTIKSNGTSITTQTSSINFTGDSVTTTTVGNDVTVDISGIAIGINLDGGGPGSVYGGINPIDGGYI